MSPTGRFVVKAPGAAGFPGRPVSFGLDKAGRVTSWSRGAQELFGDAPGGAIIGLLPDHADRRALVEALAEAAEGHGWEGVLAARCADGGVRDIEICLDPVLHPEGAVLAAAFRPGALTGDAQAADLVRLALTKEASSRIGTTLDLGQTARELMNVAVPRFADAAGILVHERLVSEGAFPDQATNGSAVVRRLAVGAAGAERNQAWAAAFPVDEVTVYAPHTPYARCMATGTPIVFPALETPVAQEIARYWGRPIIAELLDRNSMLIAPLKARGKVLGFVVFTRLPQNAPFGEQDESLAEELTARTAVCIDNARLYHRERRTALTLQSSLLPKELSAPAGVEIAHRYLPASDMIEVGGDWYDVIPLPGFRVALVVGDVMGHGIRGATMMGQLRTAVRTLAVLDLPPEKVLAHLDQMAQDLDSAQFATCVYATYDPVSRRLNVARAGHVPPMLMHPCGTGEIIDIPPGLPLGIGGERFEARELTLPDHSTLVLCTDGLVESRAHDIEWGLTCLQESLAEPECDLEELCDNAIAALGPHLDERDDIALLLARVHRLGTDRYVAWTLPDEPYSARRARALVSATLSAWGVAHLSGLAGLLATELVTNAIRYAPGPIELRLLRGDTLLCEVADASPEPPQPRTPDITDERGRGLQLIDALARRWGTRYAGEGKIVWCEIGGHLGKYGLTP